MKNQNRLEISGFMILAIGGILFLIDKFLNLDFLNPVMEFREIILYSGLAIWAFGLMQKRNLKRRNSVRKEDDKIQK